MNARFATLLLLAVPSLALADRRYYGETYNATTAQPGGLDVELWSTLHQAPREGGLQLWRHQLELETGITNRWDVALYNVFRYEQGDTTRYEALKVESRYRLSDPGEWFVDPVLYLELSKEFVEDRPFSVEEKIILAKDAGAFNVSLNLIAEQELIPGGDREYEWGYALGASYELHPMLRVGAETFGSVTRLAEGGTLDQLYAGPAISLAVARSWLVLAAGFGLNDQSERARLRAVLAFQF